MFLHLLEALKSTVVIWDVTMLLYLALIVGNFDTENHQD